jgi:capsule polysaccharide export protein KpsE/RkpR
MATPANVQVSIVTQEDKERYQKKIDLARSKIVFPDNPCLFTAGVKIQSHNYKMAQRLSKMSNSKRRGSRSTQ